MSSIPDRLLQGQTRIVNTWINLALPLDRLLQGQTHIANTWMNLGLPPAHEVTTLMPVTGRPVP